MPYLHLCSFTEITKIKPTAFDNLNGAAQELSMLLNSGYIIREVLVNGNPAEAKCDNIEEKGNARWHISVPACEKATVEICYGGSLKNNGSLLQTPVFGICNEYVYLPSTGFSPGTETSDSDDCNFSGVVTLDEKLMPLFLGVESEELDTIFPLIFGADLQVQISVE